MKTRLAPGALVILAACVVPPAAGPYPGSPAPASTAAATTATAGASCAQTIVCYGVCDPMTDACVAACDAAAAPGAAAASHALVVCMSNTGCDTEECLREKCPQEHAACLADLPPQVAATGTGTAPSTATLSDGFQYNTATFDDGWTATAHPDFVLAEKQGVRVYLYHGLPYNASQFSGTGLTERDHYWDTVVARDFAVSSKQERNHNVIGMKAKYLEGWATDRDTRERRFLMLYVVISTNVAQLVVVSAPDQETAFSWFPNAAEPYTTELPGLLRYNRFPVGDADLVGIWSDGASSMTEWYNADTGAYAGATVAALSATFRFAADGTYTSTHNGATGRIGAMNTFQQEYRGDYTVSPWSVTATNRWQGGTETFEAHFQVVRGGRLLSLATPGISYLLVRTAR